MNLVGLRRSARGWWRADCPLCLDRVGTRDRKQSLGVKPSLGGYYLCHRCGARGHEDDLEALRADDGASDLDEARGRPDFPAMISQFTLLASDDAWSSLSLRPERDYLLSRGISRETIRAARIGCDADSSSRWRGRVIVPVLAEDGDTWVGFSARDWTGRQDPKYRYPRGMRRGECLYNQAALYERSESPLIVVEGVFDALPYWPDAVACLGKPGPTQREMLLDSPRPIAVVLDGDAHGESWALSQWLSFQGARAGFVRLPPKTDPGSVEPSWLRQAVRECVKEDT